MNAADLIKQLPGAFKQEIAKDAKATFQFNISQPCHLRIENGSCQFFEGVAEKPDLTMTASDENLAKVLKGELNGMMAVMTGKLKTQGNLTLGQKMTSFFDMSKIK